MVSIYVWVLRMQKVQYVVHAWTDDRSWVAKLRLGHTILRGKGTFGKQDGVSVGLAYFFDI